MSGFFLTFVLEKTAQDLEVFTFLRESGVDYEGASRWYFILLAHEDQMRFLSHDLAQRHTTETYTHFAVSVDTFDDQGGAFVIGQPQFLQLLLRVRPNNMRTIEGFVGQCDAVHFVCTGFSRHDAKDIFG